MAPANSHYPVGFLKAAGLEVFDSGESGGQPSPSPQARYIPIRGPSRGTNVLSEPARISLETVRRSGLDDVGRPL